MFKMQRNSSCKQQHPLIVVCTLSLQICIGNSSSLLVLVYPPLSECLPNNLPVISSSEQFSFSALYYSTCQGRPSFVSQSSLYLFLFQNLYDHLPSFRIVKRFATSVYFPNSVKIVYYTFVTYRLNSFLASQCTFHGSLSIPRLYNSR